MNKSYDQNKVFRTTPERTLDDTVFDTVHSLFWKTIPYAGPFGVALAAGFGSAAHSSKFAVACVASILATSTYVQFCNYTNDLKEELGDTVKQDFPRMYRERASIGVLRGTVEGSIAALCGMGASVYLHRVIDSVK